MNYPLINFQVSSLESLFHMGVCPILNELESEEFQQKNVCSVFKDAIIDVT